MYSLKGSVDFALIDHIIEHHIYKTDKEANKYFAQNTNSFQIKSRFLEGLTLYDMYCMITLKVSADFALIDHILECHLYKTDELSKFSTDIENKTKKRTFREVITWSKSMKRHKNTSKKVHPFNTSHWWIVTALILELYCLWFKCIPLQILVWCETEWIGSRD